MSRYEELKHKKQDLESRFYYVHAEKETKNIKKRYELIDETLKDKSEEEIITYLQTETENLKQQLQSGNANRNSIRRQAYALCMYSISRMYQNKLNVNVVPYDEQISAAILMDEGYVIEMGTGEGKTLTGMLSAYFNVLEGKNTHILTCDDFLVHQGYDDYHEAFEYLGLSVSYITEKTTDAEKQKRYKSDIIYATSKRVAFDYLHDEEITDLDKCYFTYSKKDQRNMQNISSPFQSTYAILDEFDHLGIDEAKTPHINSSKMKDIDEEDLELYKETLLAVDKFVTEKVLPNGTRNITTDSIDSGYMYTYIPSTNQIELSEAAYKALENDPNLAPYIEEYKKLDGDMTTLYFGKMIQKSLIAHLLIKKDKNYLVSPNDKNPIKLIDTSIGKVAEGKKYEEDMHAAIIAKEINEGNISPTYSFEVPTYKSSSIVFKNFLNLYGKKTGMSGTARDNIDEFGKIYGMRTISIPSHFKKPKCKNYEIQTFQNSENKNKHIMDLVLEKSNDKLPQPILIGTNSVKEAEKFAKHLEKRFKNEGKTRTVIGYDDIKNNKSLTKDNLGNYIILLTAKNQEAEDEIVKEYAGKPNCIIVSTNMVGRGVDFKIDPSIKDKGLCVISTSLSESIRYEKQLRGRAGRQGAAGETYAFASLEDEAVVKSNIGNHWHTLSPSRARHIQRRLERNSEAERISSYRKHDPIELFRRNYFAARLELNSYTSDKLLNLLTDRYLEQFQENNGITFDTTDFKKSIINEIKKQYPNDKILHKTLVSNLLECYKEGWVDFQYSVETVGSISSLSSYTKQENFETLYQNNLGSKYEECMNKAEETKLAPILTKLIDAKESIDKASLRYAKWFHEKQRTTQEIDSKNDYPIGQAATAK